MGPIEQQQQRYKKLQRRLKKPQKKGLEATYIDSVTGSKSSVRELQPAVAAIQPDANWPTFWLRPDKIEKRARTDELLGDAVASPIQQWSNSIDVTSQFSEKQRQKVHLHQEAKLAKHYTIEHNEQRSPASRQYATPN